MNRAYWEAKEAPHTNTVKAESGVTADTEKLWGSIRECTA